MSIALICLNPNGCASYIVRYITYDGRHNLLYTIHFKLLSHLRHNRLANVPKILYNLLKWMASEYQRKQSDTCLSHHFLITMFIKRSLRIQYPQVQWEDFKECIDINSLLDASVVPEDAKPQNEPQDEPIEENPHVSLVALPTHSQGKHEELEEPKYRPHPVEELPSS